MLWGLREILPFAVLISVWIVGVSFALRIVLWWLYLYACVEWKFDQTRLQTTSMCTNTIPQNLMCNNRVHCATKVRNDRISSATRCAIIGSIVVLTTKIHPCVAVYFLLKCSSKMEFCKLQCEVNSLGLVGFKFQHCWWPDAPNIDSQTLNAQW